MTRRNRVVGDARRDDRLRVHDPGVIIHVAVFHTTGFAGAHGVYPPLIEAVIRHGVFDALDKGAKTIEALCAETGTSPRALRTVLNALVGLDLLSKDAEGRYALTEESATFLVNGKPTFHGAFFLLTSDPMLSSWGKLHEVMRTGRPTHRINQQRDGVAFFLRFVEDIFPIHYAGAQALAKALGVSKAGSGVWSVALAQQSPQIRVTAVLTGETASTTTGMSGIVATIPRTCPPAWPSPSH